MKKLDTYKSLCALYYELDKPEANPDALQFYLNYVQHAKGAILEPMCGTGRYLIPFIEQGFPVEGCDASFEMLSFLYRKAKQKNITL